MTAANRLFSSFLLAALLAGICSAFAPIAPSDRSATSSRLSMVPKYSGGKWEPTCPEEEPSAGYGPTKTLLLHGPQPYFNRIFQPDDYEQAVLKFMAGDKCDRNEAQGNMDFYLANPNDWAFNRFEMEKKGVRYDYTTLQPKQVGLTLVWSSIVVFFLSNTLFIHSIQGNLSGLS